MQSKLILTVLGADRPGLVQSLSEVLNQQQANWTESRMIHLGGQFAGLLQVVVPDENLPTLKTALEALKQQGLQLTLEQADNAQAYSQAQSASAYRLNFEVLGQDRPGIIRDITRQLADLGVNIEELCSEQRPAPMSSELLFFADLSLSLPEGVTEADVQNALEALSDQLMVDLKFADPDRD